MTKYGIAYDSGSVAAHFGRCPEYLIAEIENGEIKEKKIIPNPGHAPGNIPKFMHEKGVEVMVSGGMGRRAIQFFDQFGIKVVVGATGRAEDCLKLAVEGNLKSGQSMCSPKSGRGQGVLREDTEANPDHEHQD